MVNLGRRGGFKRGDAERGNEEKTLFASVCHGPLGRAGEHWGGLSKPSPSTAETAETAVAHGGRTVRSLWNYFRLDIVL
jgi:hypothetical protein